MNLKCIFRYKKWIYWISFFGIFPGLVWPSWSPCPLYQWLIQWCGHQCGPLTRWSDGQCWLPRRRGQDLWGQLWHDGMLWSPPHRSRQMSQLCYTFMRPILPSDRLRWLHSICHICLRGPKTPGKPWSDARTCPLAPGYNFLKKWL